MATEPIIDNQTHEPLPDKLENYNYAKSIAEQLNFKTLRSQSIKLDVIEYAITLLDREKTILRLMDFVDIYTAEKIEGGIFEYSLLILTEDPNRSREFLDIIYQDTFKNIIKNLDINNKYVQNKTLLPAITKNKLDPYYLAFMKPEQLHPTRWAEQIKKKETLDNMNSEIKVTDLHTCYKCGGKKCVTSQIQTRSADEPMTIFITCIVCYNTFTK